MVVGCTLRRLDDRPFLGHTVEHVLEHSDATVIAVVLPLETDQHHDEDDTAAAADPEPEQADEQPATAIEELL